jgi:hypothetical protein
MKYRVYRVIGILEYKDVESENSSDAYKCRLDSDGKEWHKTDGGLVLGACLDEDFNKEKTLQELRYEKKITNV